jgi:heme A synthase
MKLDVPVPWRLEGDQRLLVAAAHLIVSLAFVGIMGALWAVHMLRGWRMKRNLLTGILMVGLLVVLALSAVGIYYLGDEVASKWASLIHTGLGVTIGLMVWLHVIIGRAARKQGQ